MQEANTLKILTLNIWGLPFSDRRAFRMHAIGKALAAMSLDLIGLQEAWFARDRNIIARYLASNGVRYTHYFRSGRFGSGLFLLSRFPLVGAEFYPFSLGGMLENVARDGEILSAKGIGVARVRSPFGWIDVYNTHPIAQYTPDIEDDYCYQRAVAMLEAARWINAKSRRNAVVALGDFNIRPDQFEYKLLTGLTGLRDSYSLLHPMDAGVTLTSENPYQPQEVPKRLDYIFIRDSRAICLQPVSASTVMKQIPESVGARTPVFYSDHYGVRMELRLLRCPAQEEIQNPEDILPTRHPSLGMEEVFLELRSILEKAVQHTREKSRLHGINSFFGLLATVSLKDPGRQNARQSAAIRAARWLGFLYAVVQFWISYRILYRQEKYLRSLREEIEAQYR